MDKVFDRVYTESPHSPPAYRGLVRGEWTPSRSRRTMEVTNPATGEVVATIPAFEPDEVDEAVRFATDRFRSLPQGHPEERLERLIHAADLIREHGETLARMLMEESGKPITLARSEVTAAEERLRLASQEIPVLQGELLAGGWVKDTVGKTALVSRRPLGVIAAIGPFNYPLYIPAAKIVPAILAGNVVVIKPASETPLTLLLFVRLLEEAGVPPGVLTVVTGSGAQIGDTLAAHESVAMISFTGSTEVGRRIAAHAGMKRMQLELGGKGAAIILQDAPLEAAARECVRGAFRNSGQRCDAISRILIERPVKERFVELAVREAEAYQPGDPRDPSTTIGPLINTGAVEWTGKLVEDAVRKGARIVIGGKSDRCYFWPTILDGVTPEMDIAWEEIFGPVLPILEVRDREEAVALSNRSRYGLDAAVFTRDLAGAWSIANRLDEGAVTINAAPSHGVGFFPYGGNKESGIGREGLRHTILEMTKTQTIVLSTK